MTGTPAETPYWSRYREGFDEGHRAGWVEGYDDGYADAMETAATAYAEEPDGLPADPPAGPDYPLIDPWAQTPPTDAGPPDAERQPPRR